MERDAGVRSAGGCDGLQEVSTIHLHAPWLCYQTRRSANCVLRARFAWLVILPKSVAVGDRFGRRRVFAIGIGCLVYGYRSHTTTNQLRDQLAQHRLSVLRGGPLRHHSLDNQ